jgi:hypothetical protein
MVLNLNFKEICNVEGLVIQRKLFGWGHVKGKFDGKLPRKNIWCQINSRARNQSNNHSKYSNLNAYDVF